MANKYSLSEFFKVAYAFSITKILYSGARLIRRPFYLRGRNSLKYGTGLTTGYSCRFDLAGNGKTTLIIGEHCQMGDHVHIVAHNRVRIGDYCLLASKIFISDSNHGKYKGSNQSLPITPPNDRSLDVEFVEIGERVWIGDNVCILPGVTIGNGAIIGANAVVSKDIPENTIAAGIPAKVIKTFDEKTGKWQRVD